MIDKKPQTCTQVGGFCLLNYKKYICRNNRKTSTYKRIDNIRLLRYNESIKTKAAIGWHQ